MRNLPFMTEALGWFSSFVLVLTIGKQVHKQWKDGSSEGVSKWLFLGQITASVGFTLYSWLVHNWVFVVTNALLLASALVGICLVFQHRNRAGRGGGGGVRPAARPPAGTARVTSAEARRGHLGSLSAPASGRGAQVMDAKHQVAKLRSLAQLDVDAIGAYDAAIARVSNESVRERLGQFRADHFRHVKELNGFVHALGGEPLDIKADLKGALMKGMTAMTSMMGTEAALIAMMGNEEVTNHAYDAILRLEWSPDIRLLLEKNREDERRHLNWIREAAKERSPLHLVARDDEARV